MTEHSESWCRNSLESPVYSPTHSMKMVPRDIPRKVKLSNLFNQMVAIVFDLESTLIKTAYKKYKLPDYDSSMNVNILGS